MQGTGKKILGIVPARGGSKGIPGKNIKLFLGKPLIAWKIEAPVALQMAASSWPPAQLNNPPADGR